jgi:hypothetical protein
VQNSTPGKLDGFLAVAINWVDTKGAPAFVHLGNALGAALLKGMLDILKNITIGTFTDFWNKAPKPSIGGVDLDWTHYLPGGPVDQDNARKRAEAIAQVAQTTAAAVTAAHRQVSAATTRAAQDSATALHAMYVRLGLPDVTAPPIATGGQALAEGLAAQVRQQQDAQRAALERSLQFGSADHQRAAAALASAAGAGAGNGGTATTPAAASLLAQGPSTQVNITVQVGSGAVQVQQGGKADAGTRDYGLKVGEAIADALARFARAEQAVPLPPRHAVAGARG